MGHGVFGGKERGGEVVVSAGDKDPHVRVSGHGFAESFAGVGMSFTGAAPIPRFLDSFEYAVFEIGFVSTFGAGVVIVHGGVGAHEE